MRFDDLANLPELAAKTGFTIFELPKSIDQSTILQNSYHIAPNEKNNIPISTIREELLPLAQKKQSTDFFIVIEHAEVFSGNPNTANATLKVLEEPNDKLHLVLLVNNARQLLPTIRSRAHLYYLTPQPTNPTATPSPDPEILDFAKKYLTATPRTLPALATSIVKKKDKSKTTTPRLYTLTIIDAAITIAYQSYLKTGDQRFLTKLSKLLNASDAIKKNGNIKLQLIANML